MRSRAFALLNGIVLLATLACHSSLSPDEQRRTELARREAQWKAAGQHDYVFDYDVMAMVATPPVRVEVRADTVYRVVERATGQDLTAQRTWPTIDALFAELDTLVTRRDIDLSVTYDAQRGYPTLIATDVQKTPDTFITTRVTNFVPVGLVYLQ
ncbi:MAG TPA: DUF6174 domain-containing protein [Gemmatimonadaceae bacterium]|nr:DUF6174 domain-containing protein [Gemmatimonadaceae bacterium]